MPISQNWFSRLKSTQLLPAWHAFRSRGDLSVFWAIIRSRANMNYSVGTNREHLDAAMQWLCLAQDQNPDAGVSGWYDVVAGSWYPSYPETTGYIIPTFFDYFKRTSEPSFFDRAVRMADWLAALQLSAGGFPGPDWIEPKGEPIVFDTGQIIHGLMRAYEETKKPGYLAGAQRAVDWLIDIQNKDGSWIAYDMGFPHTYNSRSAWAILRVDQIAPCDRYRLSARRHIDWVLQQQTEDGWFEHTAFEPAEIPLTHTIAYTIEGILECAKLLPEQRYLVAAQRSADALLKHQAPDGSLRGRFSRGWTPTGNSICLTGNAQMAIIWLELYHLTGGARYCSAAKAAISYLKRKHARFATNPAMRGGVTGSYPIYGDYGHYQYINWATKFFADSLMLADSLGA